MQSLNDKLCNISDKLISHENVITTIAKDSTQTPHTIISSNLPAASANIEASSTQINDDYSNELTLKLDDLEQKSNSNILLCKGEIIDEIISSGRRAMNWKSAQ